MLIVGEKEQEENCVSVRRKNEGDLGTFDAEAFIDLVNREVENELLSN